MQIRSTNPLSKTAHIDFSKPSATASQPNRPIPVDQLDLSAAAQELASSGTIRADRVADIRAKIARGDYDSPEKMSRALDRLLDDLA